ncbi:competence protein ComGC [Lentilactobacillus kosonis]|uniref:competence protein ComGC n=1 Tax=Lentilactobacillus kosonis TaxID=2810561 RepID=UPI003F761787
MLILIIIPNLSTQRKHAQGIHSNAMVSVVQSQLDAYVSEFPKQDKITFADLQQEGYLSKRQVKEAQDNGIKIKASKVVK